MMQSLRQLFARRDDPYLGVDVELARKMACVFWFMGSLLTVVLWPFSPPDGPIGSSGWVVGAIAVLIGLLIGYEFRTRPSLWGFKLMLAAAYLGVAGISLMQWLAGGSGTPYDNLLLIPVLFVSAVYPPRMIAAFLGAVALSLAAPAVYDGLSGDVAGSAIAPLVLWTALAAAIFLLMSTIRAQRVGMKQGQEQAREEARVDELTEIGNRRAFKEALDEEMARATRMKTPLSMAMGDIEGFKHINDEFGHLEGDNCLCAVADAISTELRTPDRIFRWGGDEFVLLAPGASAEGADALADRMHAKVAVACKRPDGEPVRIHFGVAELHLGMSAKELVDVADLALMAERSARARAQS